MHEGFILSSSCIYSTEVICVKGRRIFIYIILLLFALGLLFFPKEAATGVLEGLRVCGSSVIPALFPFFVLSRLIISLEAFPKGGKYANGFMQRLFGVSGQCLPALLISFIGGYPVGISTVVSMYEGSKLTKSDAERAILFCNNSGPAFFVSMVGVTVLGNVQAGLMLYLIHCLSACFVGILLARPTPHDVNLRSVTAPARPSLSFGEQFLSAVTASCSALLNISGLILFFSVLLRLMDVVGWIDALGCFSEKFGLSGKLTTALLRGSMELSGGVLELRELGMRAFVPSAFLLGWGGWCVHFQAASVWNPAKLQPKGYYTAKLLHGLISALFAWVFVNPSPLSVSIGLLFFLSVGFFRILRQKRSSIPRNYAV